MAEQDTAASGSCDVHLVLVEGDIALNGLGSGCVLVRRRDLISQGYMHVTLFRPRVRAHMALRIVPHGIVDLRPVFEVGVLVPARCAHVSGGQGSCSGTVGKRT